MSKFTDKGLQYWLPHYLWQQMFKKRARKTKKPMHILFCFVDHFEPFHGGVDFKTAKQRVQAWVKGYPAMAEKYRDADGKPPQHTWFYPPHLNHIFLKDLVGLCNSNYGEIEMHLHHNHMEPFPDTSETLRAKIKKCIDDYSKYGIFCLPDGTKRFAFIHGDWSLDNSGGPKICGVNDEILILKEMGCFADFTFPSVNKCQAKMINTIYYCKDDPKLPKSYDSGVPVTVGNIPLDVDLMMITGPIGIRLKRKGKLLWPAIESGSFGYQNKPTPQRVDTWIKTNIHVNGRPEWVFVKIHCHGGPEINHDVAFGEQAKDIYKYLLNKYNDGVNYILHFVTSREMYNIIKAAESGCQGTPNDFRNYLIPKYIYR